LNISLTTYPNAPRVAVGGIVFNQHKVLLVLRGKPPAQGLWAIPGGAVQLGETIQTAVERELAEETGVIVKAGEIVFIFDTIEKDENAQVKYHYVIIDMIAELQDSSQSIKPGDDAIDVAWFTLPEILQPNFPVSHTTKSLLQQLMRKS